MKNRVIKEVEHLRQKPETARRRVALIGAGSITLLLFLIWAFNLNLLSPNQTFQVSPNIASSGGIIATTDFESMVTDGINQPGFLDRIKKGWNYLFN